MTAADLAAKRESAEVESPVELSIVMPCLNEARTLPACIAKAFQAIRELHLSAEVVVADNGSTDGSVELAEALGARVVNVPERGYGAALHAGIEAARGRFVIMGDADDSYDFAAIAPFVERLRGGADLVMGCRFPSGGGTIMPDAMPWKHRWIGNPLLTWMGRSFFHAPITDFYCGLRGFRRGFVVALDLRTTGMEFALEMVTKAAVTKSRIEQVPITLYKDGRDRAPHLRSWRDGWRSVRFFLLYSPRWLFLAPGVLLFLAGAAGCAALLPAPVHIGSMGFDTTTMLVAAMVLILGFQLIIYAVFTRLFAITEGLLRPEPVTTWLFSVISLEGGIAAGSILFAGGMGLLTYAVRLWQLHNFGAFDYSDSQRLVIPAVTTIIIGVQTIFASFFLSILGLARR
ncbi:MAG TPA: glycosyltransferase family 2 protein [Thermoanaerobaculia bacterium]|nr:glycosyltransferase family 2 protein [Thermoanaerobaculia bacterium]